AFIRRLHVELLGLVDWRNFTPASSSGRKSGTTAAPPSPSTFAADKDTAVSLPAHHVSREMTLDGFSRLLKRLLFQAAAERSLWLTWAQSCHSRCTRMRPPGQCLMPGNPSFLQ